MSSIAIWQSKRLKFGISQAAESVHCSCGKGWGVVSRDRGLRGELVAKEIMWSEWSSKALLAMICCLKAMEEMDP